MNFQNFHLEKKQKLVLGGFLNLRKSRILFSLSKKVPFSKDYMRQPFDLFINRLVEGIVFAGY